MEKRNTEQEYQLHCDIVKSFINCDIAKLRGPPN